MVQVSENYSNDYPIDIVYLWCNSSDSVWREKKNNELKKYGKSLDNDSVGDCRFIDNDELKYSLRSLEKFAPWINNVFIVTDNQIPEWLDTTNPKIHIINHSQILPAEALPTFNSMAIETVLHKIPNLSEHFLYANDDMFFGNFVEKSFFFNKLGAPIIRFLKRRIIKKIYRRLYGYTIAESYKLVKNKIGKSCPNFPHHNIDAYRKSDLEECRKELGITQYELADKLNISFKTISKWECGKALPVPDTIFNICINITTCCHCPYDRGKIIIC